MRTGIARAKCVAAVMFAVLVVSRVGWAQTYQGAARRGARRAGRDSRREVTLERGHQRRADGDDQRGR